MIKNQDGLLRVFAFVQATGAPVTGDAANITCKYQLNGGSRVALADTNPTEQEDGFYMFNVLAAENNGVTVHFYPESATSGVRVICDSHNPYTTDLSSSSSSSYPSIYAPPHPTAIYMASDVFTYADLVYRLFAKRGLTGSSREMHMLRIAVQDALTELAGRAHWRHYQRRVAVTTEAVAQYTNASFVASTGLITIASGSWPTNAAFGEIVYGEHRYKVVSRNSDTELLLSSVTAPPANFTGTVTWMRPSYTLPYQIKQIRSVMDEDASRPLEYMDPVEAIRHRKLARTTGQSLRYTVRPSENYLGLMEIEFSPVPATAKRFEIGMVVRPRPFSTFELSGTDGAYTSGTSIFTSASASFTSQHVGCILRLSPGSTLPKGRTQFDDSRSDYAIQTFIKSVTNSTTVVVTDAFTANGSSKGWTVSDPADINPLTMLSALEALSWEKYCHNHEQATELLPAAIRLAKLEFDRGMDADLASSAMQSPTDYDYHGFNDFEPNVNVLGG